MARIPELIDKYPVEALVAEGGMSAVYLGTHPTLDRKVILKKLTLRGDKSLGERFRREAKILMDFRHDNIVYVFDHFVSGRSNYIVMEYVEGMSAKDLVVQQRYVDNAVAAYITLLTAKALNYAHGKSVIHRDIKPANVLISTEGEVKLADFGIATSRGGEDQTLTSDGTTLGTPAYMAPEQFENSRTVDARADIYSLGVMLYELLCGQKPYSGGFSPEVIKAIQKGRYRKPRRHNPSVAPALQRLISRLMRPKRNRRPQNLMRVIRFLEQYLKQYDVSSVRGRLADLASNREPGPLVNRRTPKPLQRAISIASLVLVATVLVVSASLSAWHLWVLWPGSYGQLQIRYAGGQPPYISIFEDDGHEIPQVKFRPRFIKRGDEYVSLPFALAQGQYRLKSEEGAGLQWTTIFLPSQRSNRGPMEVIIEPARVSDAPVDIHFQTVDMLSGSDIGQLANIEVLKSGRWQDAAEVAVYAGQVQRFRVSAPGYFPQEYGLMIDSDVKELSLRAELVALPGTLRVEYPGSEPEFTLRIDGKSTVLVADEGIVREISLDIVQRKSYPLVAGRHVLRIQGDDWETSIILDAESAEQYVLDISPGQQEARLR